LNALENRCIAIANASIRFAQTACSMPSFA